LDPETNLPFSPSARIAATTLAEDVEEDTRVGGKEGDTLSAASATGAPTAVANITAAGVVVPKFRARVSGQVV